MLPHASIIERARFDGGGAGHDFRPMLAGAAPVVARADLALCHMETVYGADGDYSGYPLFKSPPEVAAGLAATGYDGCSTASNHSLDDGTDGIRRTLDALDRAGLRHAGTARTEEEARTVTVLRAQGARVAHLAYTYGVNSADPPEDRPWAVNITDEPRVLADARAARAAGADVVVVSLHWGTEWQDAPDEQQTALAASLTAARTAGRPDIDLIIGTHAHVPQAYEKVNGTWVVYGMGDQIASEMINDQGLRDPRGNQSTLGRFTFFPARPARRTLAGHPGRVRPAPLRRRRRPGGEPQPRDRRRRRPARRARPHPGRGPRPRRRPGRPADGAVAHGRPRTRPTAPP
ncbi:hypothetical protein SFUMM280S_00421 [Streptomyces fumanus]